MAGYLQKSATVKAVSFAAQARKQGIQQRARDPNWVLRDGGLHSGNITMPKRAGFMYGRLVIPCCQDCNEQWRLFSKRRSVRLLPDGYKAVTDLVRRAGVPLLWRWLALIFSSFKWSTGNRVAT